MADGGTDITERLKEAASMAIVGLDPLRYLFCSDPLERAMLVELYDLTRQQYETAQTNLAIEIANQVSRLFKK